MKITKHLHACLTLEKEQSIVIDPGSFSTDFKAGTNIAAVVITHNHPDHAAADQLQQIKNKNPEVQFFSTSEVAAELSQFSFTVVRHGDYHRVADFELEFFGDLHQEIHRSIPLIQNTAVLVDRRLYYPGDSYTPCEYPVEVLACPSSAPWLKISDVIDFIELTKPKLVFPTHNALLSDIGHKLQNSRIEEITINLGGEFKFLQPGDVLALERDQ